jgi:hypothetical protein
MPHTPTPWIGLAAVVAMFALPFLPAWLLEGPRTIRHRPQRHVCADCGGGWTSRHTCAPEAAAAEAAEAGPPLTGEIRRPPPAAELEPRRHSKITR